MLPAVVVLVLRLFTVLVRGRVDTAVTWTATVRACQALNWKLAFRCSSLYEAGDTVMAGDYKCFEFRTSWILVRSVPCLFYSVFTVGYRRIRVLHRAEHDCPLSTSCSERSFGVFLAELSLRTQRGLRPSLRSAVGPLLSARMCALDRR